MRTAPPRAGGPLLSFRCDDHQANLPLLIPLIAAPARPADGARAAGPAPGGAPGPRREQGHLGAWSIVFGELLGPRLYLAVGRLDD